MLVRIMSPPHDVPGICEYVTLNGKRDFVDATQGMDLERGRLPWIDPGGPISSHKSLEVEKLSWWRVQREGTI